MLLGAIWGLHYGWFLWWHLSWSWVSWIRVFLYSWTILINRKLLDSLELSHSHNRVYKCMIRAIFNWLIIVLFLLSSRLIWNGGSFGSYETIVLSLSCWTLKGNLLWVHFDRGDLLKFIAILIWLFLLLRGLKFLSYYLAELLAGFGKSIGWCFLRKFLGGLGSVLLDLITVCRMLNKCIGSRNHFSRWPLRAFLDLFYSILDQISIIVIIVWGQYLIGLNFLKPLKNLLDQILFLIIVWESRNHRIFLLVHQTFPLRF